MDQPHNYKDDQREAELITACALRFDGYRYADEHGLAGDDSDYSRFLDGFLAEPNLNLPRGHLHCALFLLQRAYLKEGWLRWDSSEARVVRELFLELCRDEIQVEYSNRDWWEGWETRFKPKLDSCVSFVRQRHAQTRYRD